MDRKSCITDKFNYRTQELLHNYYNGKYDDLQNKVFDNRKQAYDAIDEFISGWEKRKTEMNFCYFKDVVLKPEDFIIYDAPYWKRAGFDSEDDYLDYSAYHG